MDAFVDRTNPHNRPDWNGGAAELGPGDLNAWRASTDRPEPVAGPTGDGRKAASHYHFVQVAPPPRNAGPAYLGLVEHSCPAPQARIRLPGGWVAHMNQVQVQAKIDELNARLNGNPPNAQAIRAELDVYREALEELKKACGTS